MTTTTSTASYPLNWYDSIKDDFTFVTDSNITVNGANCTWSSDPDVDKYTYPAARRYTITFGNEATEVTITYTASAQLNCALPKISTPPTGYDYAFKKFTGDFNINLLVQSTVTSAALKIVHRSTDGVDTTLYNRTATFTVGESTFNTSISSSLSAGYYLITVDSGVTIKQAYSTGYYDDVPNGITITDSGVHYSDEDLDATTLDLACTGIYDIYNFDLAKRHITYTLNDFEGKPSTISVAVRYRDVPYSNISVPITYIDRPTLVSGSVTQNTFYKNQMGDNATVLGYLGSYTANYSDGTTVTYAAGDYTAIVDTISDGDVSILITDPMTGTLYPVTISATPYAASQFTLDATCNFADNFADTYQITDTLTIDTCRVIHTPTNTTLTVDVSFSSTALVQTTSLAAGTTEIPIYFNCYGTYYNLYTKTLSEAVPEQRYIYAYSATPADATYTTTYANLLTASLWEIVDPVDYYITYVKRDTTGVEADETGRLDNFRTSTNIQYDGTYASTVYTIFYENDDTGEIVTSCHITLKAPYVNNIVVEGSIGSILDTSGMLEEEWEQALESAVFRCTYTDGTIEAHVGNNIFTDGALCYESYAETDVTTISTKRYKTVVFTLRDGNECAVDLVLDIVPDSSDFRQLLASCPYEVIPLELVDSPEQVLLVQGVRALANVDIPTSLCTFTTVKDETNLTVTYTIVYDGVSCTLTNAYTNVTGLPVIPYEELKGQAKRWNYSKTIVHFNDTGVYLG